MELKSGAAAVGGGAGAGRYKSRGITWKFKIKVPSQTNFKTKYKENILCELCQKFEDSQEHLLECDQLDRSGYDSILYID